MTLGQDFEVDRKHVTAVAILLCVQLFMPELLSLYYQVVLRPRLVAQGAQPCREQQPLSPEYVPANCDLVVSLSSGRDASQTYYVGGTLTTTVRWRAGRWQQTETSYITNQLSFVLPFLAFATFFVATLHKTIRTGAFWSWELAKHGLDDFEKLLYFYAAPVFLSGIIFPGLRMLPSAFGR